MRASRSIELDSKAAEQLKKLVVEVLQTSVQQQQFVLPDTPLNQALQQPAASFVTLYVNDELTGCIGSLAASRPLWQDVCHNAYSSAFNDSRFSSLTTEQINQLSFDIAILSAQHSLENQGEQQLINELIAERDGLILEHGQQSAVFLPSVWQKLPIPEDFICALKQKAGWPANYWHNDIQIAVFTTQVIHGVVSD